MVNLEIVNGVESAGENIPVKIPDEIPQCPTCIKLYKHISQGENFQKWISVCDMLDRRFSRKMNHKLFEIMKTVLKSGNPEIEKSIINRQWLRPCNCEWDDVRKTQEDLELEDKVNKLFEKANISEKYTTLEYNPRLFPYKNKCSTLVEYNEGLKNNIKTQILLDICGLPGRGKTTACNFILINAVFESYKVHYIMADELAFLGINEDKELAKAESKRLDYIKTCDLVVIDDLGLNESQNRTEKIYYAIKHLVENEKSVMIIRNIPRPQMIDRMELGEKTKTGQKKKSGIFESLIKMFHTVEVEGEDLRGKYK